MKKVFFSTLLICLILSKQIIAQNKIIVFQGTHTVEETSEQDKDMSYSNTFWINSGGKVFIRNGMAETIQGYIPTDDRWYEEYKTANPTDTDNGNRPQNIFRLITKSDWENATQEMYFKIERLNLSNSENRNASNGVLFFNRYKDANNLYYAGIRVDGNVVVKKKVKGKYHTMDIVKILPGKYDRTDNPNLLPLGTWIGLRSEIKTEESGVVTIILSTDIGKTGTWTEQIRTTDNGTEYGKIISGEGFGGIRTDFMDVKFMDFIIDGKK